ncbi:GTP cyclohydrolase FolE2 [bacterium]|nr:GTP cyclohydrolase FolE2 [bacterium]MDB4368675.1 GTP cyclohydrolase FolE2 [bacterium]MDB4372187.1 GTP cyclohydrolase FolE2 [Mariniblastus sp.]MDC0294080.1 GTP cyclohydrolase FolE2 [Mariniblastus sp.]
MPTTDLKSELLPDVQSESDFRGCAIQRVGVTNVRYPLCFRSSETTQSTIGTWQMHVSLEENKRGTHMSRFLEILSELGGTQTMESLSELCELTRNRLMAERAFLRVDFPWFIEKTAPVSEQKGLLDLDVEYFVSRGNRDDRQLSIKVPATSLCPCSKAISKFGAHNQRCELTLSVQYANSEQVSLQELFQIAETAASAQLFSVIKRNDEKHVTEQAYENPKFVEDTVRDLADSLKSDSRIKWFRCSVENFESIHSHNAFAEIVSDYRS